MSATAPGYTFPPYHHNPHKIASLANLNATFSTNASRTTSADTTDATLSTTPINQTHADGPQAYRHVKPTSTLEYRARDHTTPYAHAYARRAESFLPSGMKGVMRGGGEYFPLHQYGHHGQHGQHNQQGPYHSHSQYPHGQSGQHSQHGHNHGHGQHHQHNLLPVSAILTSVPGENNIWEASRRHSDAPSYKVRLPSRPS